MQKNLQVNYIHARSRQRSKKSNFIMRMNFAESDDVLIGNVVDRSAKRSGGHCAHSIHA